MKRLRRQVGAADGTEGVVDLSSWRWHSVFEPLADADYFQRVRLDEELGTIVWPNEPRTGDTSLALDVRAGFAVPPEERGRSLSRYSR